MTRLVVRTRKMQKRNALMLAAGAAAVAHLGFGLYEVLRRLDWNDGQTDTAEEPRRTAIIDSKVIALEHQLGQILLKPFENHYGVYIYLHGGYDLPEEIIASLIAKWQGRFVVTVVNRSNYLTIIGDPSSPVPDVPNLAYVAVTLAETLAEHSPEASELPCVYVTITTPMGEVTLQTTGSDYDGTAIFVYTADKAPFPPKLIEQFRRDTNDVFTIESVPDDAAMGYRHATHLIRATDQAGNAPRLDIITDMLCDLLAADNRVTA